MVTVRVEDPDPVTEVGLNVPVAPLGRPLTEKLTAELKPFKPVTVGVKLVPLPWITVCELGDAASEKPGTPFTIRATVSDCVRLPLVPVMVNRYEPAGVAGSVVILRVDDPEASRLGLKEAPAPAGKPETLSETDPLKPFEGVTLVA